jgi:hypothetical protein
METIEKPQAGLVVRKSGAQALAMRSAALVKRGLHDLSRESNWTRKPAFVGKASKVAVSARGLVCAISADSRKTPPRVTVYDLHNSYGQLALSVPGETPALAKHLPASFAWSANSRYLAGAWAAWQPSIHVFDLDGKEFAGAFGKFQQLPSHVVWSPDSAYIAAATTGKTAALRVWPSGAADRQIQDAPLGEAGVPDWLERQTYEAEFGEEGAFHGYGKTVFSRDGTQLASVVEIQGEWADDAILLAHVPSLKRVNSFQAQGHVSDLTWLASGRAIVFCAAAQAYVLNLATFESEQLSFDAEICAAHPTLPLLACYTSWQKDAAKGHLFIADLRTNTRYDQCEAEGVAEITWSEDGSRAYAVSKDGMAYIYEPEIL